MTTTWSIGQTWWVGSTCLICTAIDEHKSHHSEEIATYDDTTRTSVCPRCGYRVRWDDPPTVHDLPWCADCQDLEMLLGDVESARKRWEDSVRESAHMREWDMAGLSGMLSQLHRAEDTYEEIRAAVLAREAALEECPDTLRNDSPLPLSGDVPEDAGGGSTKEET